MTLQIWQAIPILGIKWKVYWSNGFEMLAAFEHAGSFGHHSGHCHSFTIKLWEYPVLSMSISDLHLTDKDMKYPNEVTKMLTLATFLCDFTREHPVARSLVTLTG